MLLGLVDYYSKHKAEINQGIIVNGQTIDIRADLRIAKIEFDPSLDKKLKIFFLESNEYSHF